MTQERKNPIWDPGSIVVPDEILVPLVDHKEAETVSLRELTKGFAPEIELSLQPLQEKTTRGDRLFKREIMATRKNYKDPHKTLRERTNPEKKQKLKELAVPLAIRFEQAHIDSKDPDFSESPITYKPAPDPLKRFVANSGVEIDLTRSRNPFETVTQDNLYSQVAELLAEEQAMVPLSYSHLETDYPSKNPFAPKDIYEDSYDEDSH